VTGVNVLYILRDSNGAELRRGTLTISTSASLPASGTTWSEQVTVKMTSGSPAVTALSAKFRAAGGSGCTATKTAPWYGGDLAVGQSLTGTVAYSSSPATGGSRSSAVPLRPGRGGSAARGSYERRFLGRQRP
jgi:predicted amidohydrolase YtcJ